ncbi:MAG: M23 family metallopeptidase [Eubacterium sp.]|nr:M23 family metallopeptidase [Eubacterium sp.]
MASSDVNEKTKPIRIHRGLIRAAVVFACVFVGLSIGYFANEAGIIRGFNEGISARNERIELLEAQVAALNETIASKDSEIAILSQTVNSKSDEVIGLASQIDNMYVPTEFPLSGSASMNKTTDGDIPVIVFKGSDGDFCRASASGIVSEIRTNPKDSNSDSIAEFYVAGENVNKEAKEVKDLGFYTVITIDHGNGYKSIYMNDGDPVVSEGDTVFAGNTLYNLGSNNLSLGYEITLNDEYIDPEAVMIISG